MNNCSGKHAGMLAAAVAGGYPIETYLDPGHPVQKANLAAVAGFSGRSDIGISMPLDGCGAPTFAVSLREAATAYARLAALMEDPSATENGLGRAASRVAAAMQAHPEMVAGEGMLDTELMRTLPAVIAKVGADGIHAMAWRSPTGPLGVALKVMDGTVGRGRTAVVLGVLKELGGLHEIGALPEALTSSLTVRNHRGIEVGEVRPVFRLRRR
jgi:L-asparaginase II